jgi:hypothetical protein
MLIELTAEEAQLRAARKKCSAQKYFDVESASKLLRAIKLLKPSRARSAASKLQQAVHD